MKLKLKAPCALLTLPDGTLVDVERIGKGRFTTAWKNSHNVYLQVHEDDMSKELMSRLDHSNPHIPHCEYLERQDGASSFRWFKMPLYRPLNAKAGAAWKQFRTLQKIQEDCWRKVFHDPANRFDDANRMRQFVYEAVETAYLPDKLKEAVQKIIDESYNYGNYTVEFTKKNLAVNELGQLVLLDPVFDLDYVREDIAQRGKRHRG